jgi:hypothetical protein
MRFEGLVASLACVAAAWAPASWAATAPSSRTAPAVGCSEASPTLPNAPPAAADPTAAHLPAGTLVDLELAETVASKVNERCDTFAIRLVSPIMLDGGVLVPAGTTGLGQVVDAAPSKVMGTPAKLLVAARYIEFNGVRLRLKGLQLGAVGQTRSDVMLVSAFVPYTILLTAFVHGGEIEIPAGTRAQAKLVADLYASTVHVVPAPSAPSTPPDQGSPK